MELHAQASLHLVGGDGEAVESVVRAAGEGLHHNVAVVVFSARLTHGIDESLVVAVLHGLLLSGGSGPVDGGLIGACEDEPLVVIAEIGGNAGPEGGQHPVVLLLLAIVGVAVVPLLMVGIDDDIHILFEAPVDDLLHTGEPVGIDNHVGGIIHMVDPSHRYTDGIEPRLGHSVDHGLGRLGVAPFRLGIGTLERVAEVPSHHHIARPFLCAEGHSFVVGLHSLCPAAHRGKHDSGKQ